LKIANYRISPREL